MRGGGVSKGRTGPPHCPHRHPERRSPPCARMFRSPSAARQHESKGAKGSGVGQKPARGLRDPAAGL